MVQETQQAELLDKDNKKVTLYDLEELLSGKTKTVYKAEKDKLPDELKSEQMKEEGNYCLIEFRDDITAGNGATKDTQETKGILTAQISAFLFNAIAHIPNHYIKAYENKMLAILGNSVPIEVIFRFSAAGSFVKRYGLKEGTILANLTEEKAALQPMLEFCLKNDELGDPFLNEGQIISLGLVSKQDLETIKKLTINAAISLRTLFNAMGIDLIDGKFEFIKNAKGVILLADELSPDVLRLRGADDKSLDKDIFRKEGASVIEKYTYLRDKLYNIYNQK